MESLYKIKVHRTRFCVILYDHIYPSVAPTVTDDRPPEPFHEHPVFEVFLIKSGAIEFLTPNGGVTHQTGVVIIPPHVRHRTVPQGCDAVCLSFAAEPKYEHEATVGAQILRAIGTDISVLPLDPDRLFYIDRVMHPISNDDVPHLLTLFFSSLLLPFIPQKSAKAEHLIYRTKHTSTVETFVTNNIHKKVRLSDLAAALSLSEKQSARLLKKHFGCTLSELIHKTRMEGATVMLKYTDLDVNEIAHRLGYEYENYFYTVFRKHYGVTPTEYRAKALEELKENTIENVTVQEKANKEDIWTS